MNVCRFLRVFFINLTPHSPTEVVVVYSMHAQGIVVFRCGITFQPFIRPHKQASCACDMQYSCVEQEQPTFILVHGDTAVRKRQCVSAPRVCALSDGGGGRKAEDSR